MAVPTSLESLRRLVDEPTTATYTDAELQSRLDLAKGDKNVVALDIWTEKLAATVVLVNVSEGGSTRSMGQAFDHAEKMVEHFTGLVATSGGTKIRKLTRPKAR